MTKTVERVAFFKVPKKEDGDRLIAQFKELKQTAVKDGEPYILSIEAGHIVPNPPPQPQAPYSFAVRITFTSRDDLIYYATADPAHKKVIEIMESVRVPGPEGVMGVTFLGELSDS